MSGQHHSLNVHHMKNKSFKERMLYFLDIWMSRGTASMLVMLFIITGIIVSLIGLLAWLSVKTRGVTAGESIWNVLLHTLDPGVISADQGSDWFLLLMLLATFAGVFFLALLIGFINDAIASKMEDLAMGREAVIEEGHTIILGFNESTMIMLEELIEANRNQSDRRNAVVVMDRNEKKEIEEKIKTRFPNTGNIQVVCRSGSIYNRNDLMRCSILTCKSIIIAEDNDFDNIKSIIACTQILNSEGKDAQGYITAVINKKINERAARIAGFDAGTYGSSSERKKDRLELLMLEKTIAKIMTHTCRQTGLSKAFIELFNFIGSEFYIADREYVPGLYKTMTGKTIREINRSLPYSIAVGIIDKNGEAIIGDPNIVRLESDSSLILLAEDDNIVEFHTESEIISNPPVESFKESPVKVLIMETNTKLSMILEEMSHYLFRGSEIMISAAPDNIDSLLSDEIVDTLKQCGINVTIDKEYHSFDCDKLAELIDSYNPDFILCLSDYLLSDEEADEKSLALLLYIEEYRRKHPGKKIGVTSEMKSMDNQYLIQNSVAGDFIISRNFTSLMMTQISENRILKEVFDTLLSNEGFEVYMKPAKYYFNISEETDLYSISDAVAEKNEILIGYMINENGEDIITVNPRKREKNQKHMIKFNEDDQLIVLAEDHIIR